MSKTSQTKTMNQKEKTIGFFYVLILFIVTTTLCSFILFFSNSDYRLLGDKESALKQMERIKRFEQAQLETMPKVEEVEEKVSKIDPALNASYKKREINYILGEIRNVYTQNKWDERYKIFDHIATFYEFYVSDKERLWSIRKNIDKFNADLERCRNNTENKKNNLR
ncbi:type VI secretion system transmembrane protein TssO [Porphyromonas endodontalis]|jgi:hypothetical protein|uniref:Type VI secretion system transmembrane protein TssO n=1 Tax=Porphyromonas endodontalis (strain ATCC 35406 / DSM 24491 / JCM 8526 / CCUG 16442 / BCRC 14492 / NCTC 13058 / HG 370) TaxID=553175 RepID=C3JB60_POREA|nr:type VI secretion system transmembrane protein TssO [Porphyromonas endodontalis]EEN82560.1 hypothetical protein POREN0001_1503 [Porphyromonas endodontalis ATCC 35406]UBH64735.1 type VI secretion system transmembrane protein TssO [Porphyromonas endodontalis]SUB76838.1 Uncharacterised protein [Porphyromonas endodontalis]